MAKFSGTLKDFETFIGPRLRNIVQTKISKTLKKSIGQCEHCNKKESLEAAHLHGSDRKTILKKSLLHHITDNEIIDLDLLLFEARFIENHYPIENTFKILCKNCHREYDRIAKKTSIGNVIIQHKKNEFSNMKTNDFKDWLINVKGYKTNVAGSRVSNCQKVEIHHGDLDDHYKKDRGAYLLELLCYSTNDERENRKTNHNIPIDGKLRTGSATFKQAINLYMKFKSDENKKLYSSNI